jgi:hypothetical protein
MGIFSPEDRNCGKQDDVDGVVVGPSACDVGNNLVPAY